MKTWNVRIVSGCGSQDVTVEAESEEEAHVKAFEGDWISSKPIQYPHFDPDEAFTIDEDGNEL